MASNYKVLGRVAPAANTATTLYTVPAYYSTVVSTLMVCNQTTTASTYAIAVRPSGATLDPKHYIAYNAAIPAQDTVGLTIGLTMSAADVITVFSANSSTSFNLFGSEVSLSVPVTYLVVAGGGAGGTGGNSASGAGGGGAGGILTGTISIVYGAVISVVIGAGGTAASVTASSTGTAGVSSSLIGQGVSIVPTGGGYGGTGGVGAISGGNGGSGGGTVSTLSGGAPGTGIIGQGNSGAYGSTDNSTYTSGGGGGGATAAGQNSGGRNGGAGGAGYTSSISGTSTTYAGGGAGGQGASGTAGTGGTGGGGGSGAAGTPNTGGGGGGNYANGSSVGAAGGSGVVIVSHANTVPLATVTGNPSVANTGGNIVYVFTASGTIIFNP